jgi:hypothetical protein
MDDFAEDEVQDLDYYKRRCRILGAELMRVVDNKKMDLLREKLAFCKGFQAGRKTKLKEGRAWEKFKGYKTDARNDDE